MVFFSKISGYCAYVFHINFAIGYDVSIWVPQRIRGVDAESSGHVTDVLHVHDAVTVDVNQY